MRSLPLSSSFLLPVLLCTTRGGADEVLRCRFNFAFIIPSSTPVSERCVYGRTRHYGRSPPLSPTRSSVADPSATTIAVKAMVEFEGGLLDSSISSSLVGVWIIPNPLPPGELPLPTNLTIEKFSEDLGVRFRSFFSSLSPLLTRFSS